MPIAPAVPAGRVAVASTSREQIHKMHASGLSGAEIARQLGLDRTTVYVHINTPIDAPVQTRVNTAEVLRLRESGIQISEIGKQLNIPISTLYAHLPPTDRDRPQGKTREEVRRLKATGMSVAEIAKQLGVSAPTVYHHLSSGSTNPVGGRPGPGRPPKNPIVSLVM
jgi:DNA-binding CsgD family transcriptional regulator